MPPKVSDAMDDGQKWAVACTRMALADAGWPERPLDLDRTAVILGNAMGGEQHYLTTLRISFPELARELERAESFAALPADVRAAIGSELRGQHGRLAAGDQRGHDARRAEQLHRRAHRQPLQLPRAELHRRRRLRVGDGGDGRRRRGASPSTSSTSAITGGVDRNMGASSFVKFCAIGALSPTGTRPYADGADGFVMGEGAGLFVLKRLTDAERDGDRVYAVVRGVGGASDGKGKGITAPNPVGQRLAVERAWRNAGLSPADCTLVEGHGTSTRVGDVVEVGSLMEAFAGAHLAPGSVALGSVKSNIGHLKARGRRGGHPQGDARAARQGAAAEPATSSGPTRTWTGPDPPSPSTPSCATGTSPPDRTRVAGVSAFGFGGTNFHVVMEEHVPGHLTTNGHGRDRRAGRRPRRATARPARRPAPAGAAARAAPSRRCAARSCSAPTTRRRSPTAAHRAGRGAPGPPPRPGAAERGGAARARADRDRLRRRRRARGQGRASRCGRCRPATPPPGRRCAGAASSAAAAAPGQGRLPLHRPGLAVRQHARRAAPARAGRRRDSSTRPTRSWRRCSRAGR